MKWDKVRQGVASELYTRIRDCKMNLDEMLVDLLGSDFKVLRDLPSEEKCHFGICQKYADQAYNRIMDWDVRCAGRLRDLFPSYWPKSLGRGKLVAGIGESGDWEVWAE